MSSSVSTPILVVFMMWHGAALGDHSASDASAVCGGAQCASPALDDEASTLSQHKLNVIAKHGYDADHADSVNATDKIGLGLADPNFGGVIKTGIRVTGFVDLVVSGASGSSNGPLGNMMSGSSNGSLGAALVACNLMYGVGANGVAAMQRWLCGGSTSDPHRRRRNQQCDLNPSCRGFSLNNINQNSELGAKKLAAMGGQFPMPHANALYYRFTHWKTGRSPAGICPDFNGEDPGHWTSNGDPFMFCVEENCNTGAHGTQPCCYCTLSSQANNPSGNSYWDPDRDVPDFE